MNLFNYNINSSLDFYEKSKFLLAWRVNLIFSVVFFGLCILYINSPIEELKMYFICFIISMLCLGYLFFIKKAGLVYLIASFLGTIILFFTINILPRSNHSADYCWIGLVILFAFFGLGKRNGIFITALNGITVIFSAIYTGNLYTENLIALERNVVINVEVFTALSLSAYIIYEFLTINNYYHAEIELANSELRAQNEIIKVQNDEKTVLIKEIHHRVKNNLQIIISLLRLQQYEIQSEDVKKQFGDAINRIMAMSLIHQKLYLGDSLSKVNLEEYINDLCKDISSISNLSKPIEYDIQVSVAGLNLKTIIPIGLMINELATNSIKHAFQNSVHPLIRIQLCEADLGQLSMCYFDNGNWSEQTRGHKGFGLELIETLTEQLDGSFTCDIDAAGTTFMFQISNI
ncbi:hypothetical protein DNU06_13510 [Putridiphycobacter roseus]|uniref:histidine kinase n=1 Tax=Putridiphycobacter roseus TaxID=2219161 RepID=A0A2W1NAJ5_9FLAO|nr:sensor histidine kinase [Putridiphycobacter roseus]PZE16325.1 hypothetical protein DNU06_13510 [Putridiphycobacter roseus]